MLRDPIIRCGAVSQVVDLLNRSVLSAHAHVHVDIVKGVAHPATPLFYLGAMSSLHAEDDYGQLVNNHNAVPPTSARQMKPTPVTVSGISFVSTLWLIFTIIVLCGLVIVAAFPRWIHNDVNTPEKRRELDNLVHRADFGLYHFCYELTVSLDQATNNATFEECTTYLQYRPQASLEGTSTNLLDAELKDIAFLFSASILYAFGFLMLLVSLVMGVVAYLKPKVLGTSMFAVAFVFQVIGGEIHFLSGPV